MNTRTLIIMLAILLVLMGCMAQKESVDQSSTKISAIDVRNMDPTRLPGDDFYRYANGGWIDRNPVPEEFGRYNAFTELFLTNNANVRAIVEDPALLESPVGSLNWKIGTFYSVGMDSLKAESVGQSPLDRHRMKITAVTNKAEAESLIPELHAIAAGVFFRIYPDQDEKDAKNIIAQITQGGLGLTDRDYYLSDDQRSENLRVAYREFLGKGLSMLGYNSEDVARYSAAIMELETRLASVSMTGVERRDLEKTYNLMSIEELSSLAPQIDWRMYFDGISAQVGMINVRQPDFFKTLGELWADTELEILKVYMEWHLYRSHSGVINTQWGDAAFAFYGTALNGTTQMQPRWRRVLRGLDRAMGEAVGREYVARHFPPEAKTRMAELVNNLKSATGQHIQELAWMTDATKAKALEKLAAMNVKIGYPDQWTDFSNLEIGTESHAANVMAGQEFQFSRDMATIGKPVDRSIWFMSPQTVNAYYSPSLNEIVFPAGILAPPFFWMDADDAVNYGGIGVVIAHEITHGFDDQGAKFDAAGNMVDWWAEEDARHFQDLAARLVDQYNGYTMLDTVSINGELTLGENIADLGGLTISYDGLQLALAHNPTGSIDGFTPEQRFLLAFAQIWRSTYRPEALMAQIKEDPHSPGRYRTIGTIVNFDPFYTAFNVEAGQAHYLPPGERLIIW